MKIDKSSKFDKHFKSRIFPYPKLDKQFTTRVAIFIKERGNTLLQDHQLTGKLKQYRAFSINGDLRVIYFQVTDTIFLFIDIGSHNQVY